MRAENMQELTDEIKDRHPGVVIGGIGDPAHKLRTSDHNEDDTAGSKAAQTDADTKPEHRAIDVMLGSAFTKADAYELIDELVGDAADRVRLRYIIFNGEIWSRSNGWKKADFDGDPHTDHVHLSGDAADDENTRPWLEDDMELTDRIKYVQGAGVSYSQPETTVGTMLGQTLYYLLWTRNQVLALQKDVAELAARPQADVDEAALAAALAPLLEQGASAEEIAAAVTATLAAKLGGSA